MGPLPAGCAQGRHAWDWDWFDTATMAQDGAETRCFQCGVKGKVERIEDGQVRIRPRPEPRFLGVRAQGS